MISVHYTNEGYLRCHEILGHFDTFDFNDILYFRKYLFMMLGKFTFNKIMALSAFKVVICGNYINLNKITKI